MPVIVRIDFSAVTICCAVLAKPHESSVYASTRCEMVALGVFISSWLTRKNLNGLMVCFSKFLDY